MKFVEINTGQLVTLADGRFSCTMDEVYSAYDSILEDQLYTHALIRASKFVQPRINNLFPWVEQVCKDYPVKGQNQTNESYGESIKEWIDSVSLKFGGTHIVPVMSEEWLSVDPMTELSDVLNGRHDDIF